MSPPLDAGFKPKIFKGAAKLAATPQNNMAATTSNKFQHTIRVSNQAFIEIV